MRAHHRFDLFGLLAFGCFAACAGSEVSSAAGGWSDAGAGSGSGGFFGVGSGGSSFGAGGSSAGGAGGDPLPPEREVESSFEVPVATGRYVWVANPLSGRVAFIDAATLKVRTVEAGNAPTYLAPVPGAADSVIVLNALSHDATLLRADGASGQLQSAMIAGVTPLANAWAISPDGKFALAWTDARRALASAPRTGTLEGFQDVTAIELTAQPPRVTTVAVGYRPVSMTFSADGRRAFVVTTDGVSVVGLPGPSGAVEVLRDVALTSVATENADTRDVSVTADGRALVRREGSAEIRIVDLTTGSTTVVTLTGPVTDLDVTPDGTRAIAVVRSTAEVAILPLASAAGDPGTVLHTFVSGRLFGSVAVTADSKKAVLFSNATDSEELIVLDLTTAGYVVQRVHAPVLSLFPTPDGKFAVVLHQQPMPRVDGGVTPAPAGSGPDGGASADAGVGAAGDAAAPPVVAKPAALAPAFSVVPLDSTRSGRIQETVAVPQAIALAPNSLQAIVTVRDDRTRVFGAYIVSLPNLTVSRLDLASPPIATGVVAAANRGYVAQVHPEGRITFIPFASGIPQTLTGFDLGARVVDGVTP